MRAIIEIYGIGAALMFISLSLVYRQKPSLLPNNLVEFIIFFLGIIFWPLFILGTIIWKLTKRIR